MEGNESKAATNRDLFRTLKPDETRKLMNDARCLMCVHTCTNTDIKAECAVGIKEWMDMDADATNWARIRSVVSV